MRPTPRRLTRWVVSRIHLEFSMAAGAAFDRKGSIETNRIVKKPNLRSTSPHLTHARRNHPTLVGGIGYSLGLLDIDPHNYVFVDLGSGKGRVLIDAVEFPFKKVDGMEFCPDLRSAAKRTMTLYREKTGNAYEVIVIYAKLDFR